MYEPGQNIRIKLCQRGLKQKWLIGELAKRDIKTEKTELSSVLNGRRVGPKARMILTVSNEILSEN